MSKNLDETVRLQSEKSVDVKGERRETARECRGHEQCSPLANLSAASFPGRYESPGTHCSLIVNEEREKTVSTRSVREFEVKGKIEGRTEWQRQT